MKRIKNIRQGLIELNFAKVEHELTRESLTPDLPADLLVIVEQTGCLLLQHADRDLELRRDQFVTSLRQWFLEFGNKKLCDRLDRHHKQAELCQLGFREISSTLAHCPVGQTAPATSAWAAIIATAADMTEVWRTVSGSPPALIAPELVFLSSESLRVNALGTHDLDPDAAAEHYAYNLGGYLKMLGYIHNWFEGGSLTIPPEVPVPPHLQEDRSALYLAEAWNQLDDHW